MVSGPVFIVQESYYEDTAADDLRISWSITISVLSLAVGIAVADSKIDLDCAVDSYVPELVDSTYAGVTVRKALTWPLA